MLYINGKPAERIETAEFMTIPTGKLLQKEKRVITPGGDVIVGEYVECSRCGAAGYYAVGNTCPCCGCRWE